MRDIALECGISKATLYHYFPDKISLLRPLAIGKHTSRCSCMSPAHDDPSLPAVDRLRVFMVETASFFGEIPLVWIAASNSLLERPEAARPARRIAWRDRYEQLMREILQAGVDSGEIRGVDVPLAGRMLHGAVNWMARWYDPKGPMTAAEIAERYCEMTLAGIGARR